MFWILDFMIAEPRKHKLPFSELTVTYMDNFFSITWRGDIG